VLVESNFTRTSNQARIMEFEIIISRTPSRTSYTGAVSKWNFRGSPKFDRKSGNLKIWECRRKSGLERGPERRGLRRHGGWNAGGETSRETANLEAWGCESGRGRGLAWEVSGVPRGVGRADFQVFRFSGSGHSSHGP
jgi:hypothetical protein